MVQYIRLPSMKVEVVGKETSCTLGEATATGGWLILTAVRKIGEEEKKGKKKNINKNPGKTNVKSTDQ